jgi:hypothetical protein
MIIDRIDFISAYCDRWCERCAFTSRCSTYAVEAATAMCGGDVQAAIELAIGEPRAVGATEPQPEPEWLADLEVAAPTADEMADFERESREREARISDMPLMRLAWACTMLARPWLSARSEALLRAADPVLREALEVVGWDATLITAKLRRALNGRDRFVRDDDGDDEPIQNDWNGSAKVALLCLERSEAAWRVIAQSTGDATPAGIADTHADLQRMTRREFPDVMRFRRPGFDDSGA